MATTIYTEAIQKLYVAYFNRPADFDGLAYWNGVVEAAKGDTTAVSAAFAAEAEYKTEYSGMSNADIVNKVYKNLFGRDAEAAGKNYWADLLDKKAITIDQVVTQIAAGAQGSDAEAYENKVIAATAFTNALDLKAEQNGYKGAEANKVAKAFISSVTTDASLTVAIAPAALAATVSKVVIAGTPFSLESGLQALKAAQDAKVAFLDAADGKADGKTTETEASIAAKVTTAVGEVAKIVVGYDTATSTGVKAALLADKVAANAKALSDAQVKVAADQVEIAKVAGLTAAVSTLTAAKAAVTAANTGLKNAAADLAAKLAAFNSLKGGTAVTVEANGTVAGLIKLDSSGKLVLETGVKEDEKPGVTALLNASIAHEAAEKSVDAAVKAQASAQAQVDYLDQDPAEAAPLAAVKAAMKNVTVAAGANPTLEQIATEQSILDAKAAADPSDSALATAASDFKAKVKAYTDVYGANPLVKTLTDDQKVVEDATAAIKALSDATAALTKANDLAAQLAAVEAAITAANQAFIDHELSLPVTVSNSATHIASAGADIFVAGKVDGTIALFGLQGADTLYIGSQYTLNTTAKLGTDGKITGGNDGVLEAFIFNTDTGTKVILEKSAFGSSAATAEVITITLTGVASTDVTLSNGIVTGDWA